MIPRREFIKMSTLGGLGLMVPKWGIGNVFGENLELSRLQKFVDPLPLPVTQQPTGMVDGATYYEMPMVEIRQKLHSQLPETTLWGYQGMYPGPTIEARRNERVMVRWINDLPVEHLLPVDTNLHGAGFPENPYVRTVVHLHGGNVPPESDGYPEAWFTPGTYDTYSYPNQQQATTLWYHDHALGITRLNVYAGLAGFYLIHDDIEDSLNLPKGKYEIPILIQDRDINRSGKLIYPSAWEPEFFGKLALVNGKVWPYLEVKPRKYRFRFLNGSNARFYNLKLLEFDESAERVIGGSFGPAFHQIGSDGGFLPAPVVLNDPLDRNAPRLLMAPAERADVIIDFSDYAGKSLLLHNDAKTPFKGLNSTAPDDVPLHKIMLFRVSSDSVGDNSVIPSRLRPLKRIDPSLAVRNRKLTLEEKFAEGEETPIELLLNGLDWDDAGPREKPRLDSVEIWSLINLTEDVHPIHLHLVQFQILDRRPFDVDEYLASKKVVYTGPRMGPDPNEMGRKDTVRANPGEVTRIIAKFNRAGIYVWHCHILEHEDNEMMRPYEVVAM